MDELFRIADESDISIEYERLPLNESISAQTGNLCFVVMDHALAGNSASARVHLAHELGHCVTGSFYNPRSCLGIRQKHENTADKWAIEHTITADELDDAIAEGCGEYWQLAERFGVTVDFIKKTVCWYTYGNLAVDQYL